MEQYILKAAVAAKIEKKLQDLIACKKDAFYAEERVIAKAKIDMVKEFLSLLDTLEVKEVDLSATVERYVEQHKSELQGYMDIRQIAKHFFELGIKAAQKGEEV